LLKLANLSLGVAKPTSRNKAQSKCQKADASSLAICGKTHQDAEANNGEARCNPVSGGLSTSISVVTNRLARIPTLWYRSIRFKTKHDLSLKKKK
jgi:hypothetical protein